MSPENSSEHPTHTGKMAAKERTNVERKARMQLNHAEQARLHVSPKLDLKRKSALGQFMTPSPVAAHMASMFLPSKFKNAKLLDAGAGLGALSSAFLERWRKNGLDFAHVDVTAHELDDSLREHLRETLEQYADTKRFTANVVAGDFIVDTALAMVEDRVSTRFTHAILNPPYKKISNASEHRQALRHVGIETVNLYTAFVALAIELLEPKGQLVAIIPRSFCNGTYYKPFRELMLSKTALKAIHLFESRSQAFADDEVLQENIIILLERGAFQGPVHVTTSTDSTFSDVLEHDHPFDRIVFPGDPERFIHVPTSAAETELEQSIHVRHTLTDLGLRVSTGPVVDFRLKDHLRVEPEAESVPILYPQHFLKSGVVWPCVGGKKANAIMVNDETRGWLMPNGFYCVVKRFSSKEERRRIVATVITPANFPGDTPFLGLENHLNVFNVKRGGLPELVAYGLAAFMNSTAVDEAFRRFSGHTQVNAGDLKTMRYPSLETLEKLGAWGKENPSADQAAIDEQFKKMNA